MGDFINFLGNNLADGRACSHDSRWLGIHLFGNSQRVRTNVADSYRFWYIDW